LERDFWCVKLGVKVNNEFQNGGSYVLAVDSGRERILSVWQWQWGHLLGKVAVSTPPSGLPANFLTEDTKRLALVAKSTRKVIPSTSKADPFEATV